MGNSDALLSLSDKTDMLRKLRNVYSHQFILKLKYLHLILIQHYIIRGIPRECRQNFLYTISLIKSKMKI